MLQSVIGISNMSGNKIQSKTETNESLKSRRRLKKIYKVDKSEINKKQTEMNQNQTDEALRIIDVGDNESNQLSWKLKRHQVSQNQTQSGICSQSAAAASFTPERCHV